MYNKSYRDKKPGGFSARGGSGFGGKGGKRFGGGGSDWKPMFDATCATCGESCKVPFRPNGRKPVYCSNCFVRDEDAASKHFSGPRSDRSERPSGGQSDVSEQLKAINAKLDAIIEALEE